MACDLRRLMDPHRCCLQSCVCRCFTAWDCSQFLFLVRRATKQVTESWKARDCTGVTCCTWGLFTSWHCHGKAVWEPFLGRKHLSEGMAKQLVSLIIVSAFAVQFGSVAEKWNSFFLQNLYEIWPCSQPILNPLCISQTFLKKKFPDCGLSKQSACCI